MLVAITKKTAIIIEYDELTIEFLLPLTENLDTPIVYIDLCMYDNLEGCLNQFNKLCVRRLWLVDLWHSFSVLYIILPKVRSLFKTLMIFLYSSIV
jgi:hypothetical protein